MPQDDAARRKRTKRFQKQQSETALLRHFPYCPGNHRQKILQKVINRAWTKRTSLIEAISIVTHNYIRHNLTSYDSLRNLHALSREEARKVVKPEVDDWFEYWHSGYDVGKPEP